MKVKKKVEDTHPKCLIFKKTETETAKQEICPNFIDVDELVASIEAVTTKTDTKKRRKHKPANASGKLSSKSKAESCDGVGTNGDTDLTVEHYETESNSAKSIEKVPTEALSSPKINLKSGKRGSMMQAGPSKKLKLKTISDDLNNAVHKASEPEGISNSIEEGNKTLEWLLHPFSVAEFKRNVWEKRPVVIRREAVHYENKLLTTGDLDNILSKHRVEFTKHVDITSYVDGVRETHNPIGRAHRALVWDYYKNGCSVRMLCPQLFHVNTWKLLSALQEVFQSFVGANIYLTPPNSQGFAPHYDDIEAFVLQIEGEKKWKVYEPRTTMEELPEDSSPNFSEGDLDSPILEVHLKPGDLLYFPRGFIHQASTLGQDTHSLHMTVSCAQKHSWKQFLLNTLPTALETVAASDVAFRESLPWGYNTTAGLAYSGHPGGEKMKRRLAVLLRKLADSMDVDSMVDTFSKDLIHQSLPPLLTKVEQERTVYGASDHWDVSKQDVLDQAVFDGNVCVKLIRSGSVRLLKEEGVFKLYYNSENTRAYREVEPNFIELDDWQAEIVKTIIASYPEYVEIASLGPDVEKYIMLISDLWERGILMTRDKLETI